MSRPRIPFSPITQSEDNTLMDTTNEDTLSCSDMSSDALEPLFVRERSSLIDNDQTNEVCFEVSCVEVPDEKSTPPPTRTPYCETLHQPPVFSDSESDTYYNHRDSDSDADDENDFTFIRLKLN